MTRHLCPSCGAAVDELVLVACDEFAERLVQAISAVHLRLDRISQQLEVVMSDQSHLDTDVEELRSAYGQVIAELKAQAANAGVAQHLDFTAADALVAAAQSEVAADAPATTTPPATAPPTLDASTTAPPTDAAPSADPDVPGTGSGAPLP